MKLICLFVILILCTHCHKDSLPQTQPLNIKQNYFVNSDSGLKLRAMPDQKSNSLQTIFNGEEVLILEELKEKVLIDKIENNWAKIQYRDKIGWAFKGYLSQENPYVGKYEMEDAKYEECSGSKYFYVNEFQTWKEIFFIGGDEGCGYTDIEGAWYLQKNKLYAVNKKYAFKENFMNRWANGKIGSC